MKNGKDKKGKTSYILTKETMGMTVLLFSAIVFLMLLTGSAVFAGIGKAICTFLYGTFGYGSWLIIFLTAYLGEWLVFGFTRRLLRVFVVPFCRYAGLRPLHVRRLYFGLLRKCRERFFGLHIRRCYIRYRGVSVCQTYHVRGCAHNFFSVDGCKRISFIRGFKKAARRCARSSPHTNG